MKKALVLGLICAVGAANAQVIIDDFSVPYTKTIVSGSNVDAMSGAVLSGERDVEMRVVSNPFGQDYDLRITGSQLAVISTGFGVLSTLKLQYDGNGDEAGNTGVNKLLTNSGASASGILAGNNNIQVRFLGNDQQLTVSAVLRKDGGIIGQIDKVRAAAAGIGSESFIFTSAQAAQADSLTFVISSDRSGDYAIEGIEAVPEPATMTAIAAGLAALAARRRRNSK